MIVILKHNPEKEKVEKLIHNLQDMGLSINYSEGTETTIVGLIGDTTKVDMDA